MWNCLSLGEAGAGHGVLLSTLKGIERLLLPRDNMFRDFVEEQAGAAGYDVLPRERETFSILRKTIVV